MPVVVASVVWTRAAMQMSAGGAVALGGVAIKTRVRCTSNLHCDYIKH